jgi:hypothetical protein
MNQFDDKIPEELELQQQELLSLLQRAYPRPAPMTAAEQEQLLGRVRERLLNSPVSPAEALPPVSLPPVSLPPVSLPPVGAGEVRRGEGTLVVARSLPPLETGTLVVARTRRTRIIHLLNNLAAILVLGAIVGVSLLLFSHGPHSEPAPGGILPPGAGGTDETTLAAHSSAGGLEMSLRLTPGPYFLSEMLAADISLTNTTSKTYYVGIPFINSACGYTTGITITGGGAPHYQIPISTDHSCPYIPAATTLKPGQTLTASKYVPLTDSGRMTLTAETAFYTKNASNSFPSYTSTPAPLDGHWPTAQINVNSSIPADRQLSFKIQGSHVIVTAPQGIPPHLLYLYGVSCQDFHDTGGTGTGNYGWEAISSNQVSVPGCPGKNVQWSFAFASPGYATVTGNYPPAVSHP